MTTAIREEAKVEEDLKPVQLFVDCDDTLLIYDTHQTPNPYGHWRGQFWHPNLFLIGQITAFWSLNPTSGIYIWSGGGSDYARECSKVLNISHLVSGFLVKDITNFHLVRSGDIVVDDDNLDGIRTHSPEEIFIEENNLA